MNGRMFIIVILLVLALVIGGCNFPGSDDPTATPTIPPPPSGPGALQTSAFLTVQAELAAGGNQGVSTQTGGISASATSAPAQATAIPSATTVPTRTPTPTDDVPCDRVAYVSDVTIPDGTELDPNESFTKTWRLRNTGSCTWTSGYDLVFFSGDGMSGPASVQLTNATVAPNQTVDVSVDLTAPNSPGTYRGNWKLRNASNVVFGLGSSGNPFYVEIEVVQAVNFSIIYFSTHQCGGTDFANVEIVNTGSEFLQSSQVTIVDLDASVTLYGPGLSNSPFRVNPNGCAVDASDADPGDTYYIHASLGAGPTAGNTARFTLKLCTEDNLGGTCLEKSVEFEIE